MKKSCRWHEIEGFEWQKYLTLEIAKDVFKDYINLPNDYKDQDINDAIYNFAMERSDEYNKIIYSLSRN